jgi:DinB superfamily
MPDASSSWEGYEHAEKAGQSRFCSAFLCVLCVLCVLMENKKMEPPLYPAGVFDPADNRDAEQCIADIDAAPRLLRELVTGLAEAQLDTKYKNWTIRQIVHHVADSHVHSYIRFKWALTESTPTIKAYDEATWVELEDARTGDIKPPLALLDGMHRRWVQLLRSMTPAQFARSFLHPETGKLVPLALALRSYAWHGKHHTAQIRWLRQHKLEKTAAS